MSLSSVIQIAQNSLSNMTTRTSVLARNINEAGNSDYARREVQTISLSPGAGSASIRRITNLRLESALAGAVSVNSGQQVHSSLIDTLSGLLAGEDGELNVSVNCLDRQLAARGDKTALLFEGDDPAVSKFVTSVALYDGTKPTWNKRGGTRGYTSFVASAPDQVPCTP